MAYRVPDTNINLSGTYQQGKGNLQISCVPDESLPLLGPNGETKIFVSFCCYFCFAFVRFSLSLLVLVWILRTPI